MSGKTILFSFDKWSLEVLSAKWPFLFTFVKDPSQSVWDVINTIDVSTLFHLPLSIQVVTKYHQFVHLIHDTHLSQEKDKWIVATADFGYKVSTLYKTLMQQDVVIHAISWLWKSCCQDKHRVFFWLLLHNKLNTRAEEELFYDRLHMHNV
jgi:hypothetical protein